MSSKNLMTIGLALAVSALSFSPTSADWTCTGTLTLATADADTGPGQTCGGDYTNTHVSDDSDQCLVETTSGGVSHLYHAWYFDSVPAGAQSLIWEGHRPNNSDGDNFKFSALYIDSGGNHGVLFSGAVINKPFEQQGGTKTSMSVTTTETTDWYLDINDTALGPNNDSVYIDYLAICSE